MTIHREVGQEVGDLRVPHLGGVTHALMNNEVLDVADVLLGRPRREVTDAGGPPHQVEEFGLAGISDRL